MESLEFFVDIFLPIAHGLGIESASERSNYHENFRGVKGGQCLGLTNLPLTSADFLEILGVSVSYSPQDLSRHAYGLL